VATKRLGRGLEALIRPKEDAQLAAPGTNRIPIKDIALNPHQPRKTFDADSLEELTASIKEKGVITPVTVREDDGKWILVAGERRLRASKKAGLQTIPAYVIEVTSEAEMMEVALIENIQRENLNSIEEAEAYAVLQSQFGLSQENIAKAVGKKRVTITNSLRLLKLPTEIRKSLQAGDISAGHGRAILSKKTPAEMGSLWKRIIKEELSVRAAETLSKDKAPPKKSKKSKQNIEPSVKQLEDELVTILGTKVKLKHKGNQGGTIVVDYYSNSDLERILDLFRSID
jgi:ParB family chromosome partitioning protein